MQNLPNMLGIAILALTACQPKTSTPVVQEQEKTEVQTTVTASKYDISKVEYSQKDSLEVMKLLQDSSRKTLLDYGRFFLGRPYVGHTLERGDEHLVVNLQGLDCATLVETCSALSRARGGSFEDYCRELEKIRYYDGKCDGYMSRMHYVTFWIADHLRRGDVEEVKLPENLTRQRTIRINYMSEHPSYYAGLKNADGTVSETAVKEISAQEKQYSGEVFRYLPQENCGLSQKQLSAIHDGDIVYIVTTKEGLDYAHQTIAVWGKDKKLHLLHASSSQKKVVEETRTAEDYLRGIKTSIGIRVFRLK